MAVGSSIVLEPNDGDLYIARLDMEMDCRWPAPRPELPGYPTGFLDVTIDKSLRVRRGMVRSRSVLNRAERLERLKATDRWKDGDSPMGLPKVRVHKMALKKKKKKKEEEGADGAAAPAKGAAGKAAAGGAKAAAAKPAAKPAAKK